MLGPASRNERKRCWFVLGSWWARALRGEQAGLTTIEAIRTKDGATEQARNLAASRSCWVEERARLCRLKRSISIFIDTKKSEVGPTLLSIRDFANKLIGHTLAQLGYFAINQRFETDHREFVTLLVKVYSHRQMQKVQKKQNLKSFWPRRNDITCFGRKKMAANKTNYGCLIFPLTDKSNS